MIKAPGFVTKKAPIDLSGETEIGHGRLTAIKWFALAAHSWYAYRRHEDCSLWRWGLAIVP